VGENYRAYVPGFEREGAVDPFGFGAMALVQAALEQNLLAVMLDQVLGAGYRLARADKPY
jgi:hypothetical protein